MPKGVTVFLYYRVDCCDSTGPRGVCRQQQQHGGEAQRRPPEGGAMAMAIAVLDTEASLLTSSTFEYND